MPSDTTTPAKPAKPSTKPAKPSTSLNLEPAPRSDVSLDSNALNPVDVNRR